MNMQKEQSAFALKVSYLIQQAYAMGYEVTLGDAYRDPRLHGKIGFQLGYGSANSFHKKRLAIDLNLFKDGTFIVSTEGHKPLGEWWKSQGGTWGGDFVDRVGKPAPDGNHYSWGEK